MPAEIVPTIAVLLVALQHHLEAAELHVRREPLSEADVSAIALQLGAAGAKLDRLRVLIA